jgi:hypothetical protein
MWKVVKNPSKGTIECDVNEFTEHNNRKTLPQFEEAMPNFLE